MNELNHPNNPLWQKQGQKRYNRLRLKLKGNISKISIPELIEQKNIVLEMQAILNRVGALKGLV